MSRSRSPSATSILLGAAGALASLACFASGCGEPCGPGDAPDVGLVASSTDTTLTYGHLDASPNQDCPAPDQPMDVVPLTISGSQTDGGGLITLCVSRPDELAKTSLSLGGDVHVIDFTGDANGCTYTLDASRPPTGTVSADGMCDDGTNAAGFALTIDGALSLEQTCNGTTAPIAVQVSGTVAVAGPQP